MKNLRELSDLSAVITQLRGIISTSSLSRFDKKELTSLKEKLATMEKEFIAGVLTDPEQPRSTLSEINKRTQAARKEISVGAEKAVVVGNDGKARVVDPSQPLPPEDMGTSINMQPATTTRLESAVPESIAREITVPEAEAKPEAKVDPMLGNRLAEAKKELVEKNKRKSVKKAS